MDVVTTWKVWARGCGTSLSAHARGCQTRTPCDAIVRLLHGGEARYCCARRQNLLDRDTVIRSTEEGALRFVLVDDSDVPVSPAEATTCVQERGLKGAAEFYGLSVSTLRTS